MSALYKLTNPDFSYVSHIDEKGEPRSTAAGEIPLVLWPNGRWCWEANSWLQHLLINKGCSTRTRGGTLLTYTMYISHLIRYCCFINRDLISLTDNDFIRFMNTLGRDSANVKRVRRNTTNRAIGHACLSFLRHVGMLHGDERFVSAGGRIDASVLLLARRGRDFGPNGLKDSAFSHRALPKADSRKRRSPISSKNIENLRRAAVTQSRSTFVRKRRLIMLQVLEITGGRRIEIGNLTVESVLNAASMMEPRIMMASAKNPNPDAARGIPISRVDLDDLLEYIKINRARVVKRTCGLKNDCGYLFINEQTGKKLSVETITLEIWKLRQRAGISEKACAHMFRHRRITKWFVMLIKRHALRSSDDIRSLLLSAETLKMELMQISGHKHINSLDHYIHLAFEEASGIKDVQNEVRKDMALTSAKEKYDRLKTDIADRRPTKSDFDKLGQLLESILHDQKSEPD